jgi:hypothetical protein
MIGSFFVSAYLKFRVGVFFIVSIFTFQLTRKNIDQY